MVTRINLQPVGLPSVRENMLLQNLCTKELVFLLKEVMIDEDKEEELNTKKIETSVCDDIRCDLQSDCNPVK